MLFVMKRYVVCILPTRARCVRRPSFGNGEGRRAMRAGRQVCIDRGDHCTEAICCIDQGDHFKKFGK